MAQHLVKLSEGAVVVTKLPNGVMAASTITAEDIESTKLKSDMDLMTARKEASKKSRGGKTIHIDVDKDGECHLSKESGPNTYNTFKNGSEIAPPSSGEPTVEPIVRKTKGRQSASLPKSSEVEQTKTNNKMSTESKAPEKKSAAKKEAPKKAAPKEAAKAPSGANLISKATTISLTAAQWKVLEGKPESIREMATKALIAKYL